jgi:hypothetical protein
LDVFTHHCSVPTGCMQGLWEFVCCGSWVCKHSLVSLTVHSTQKTGSVRTC